ncbi:hypothetical protein N7468_009306 [Penicillium chermesinum]|uniref:UDP-N-acetylglucosamine 1-carboxyvinyltransferase n=1 Tax=Penicillium chermesinum TaxID=63820 RepID=A0A9W9NHS2_9EURO|nr:uncharacterized protein N7468_009306 [Penicillium chermesinum]KAJ5220102.1 hypothetical protein N7468_009306 [Penicillium chermesinum]KAJ6157549.1 hypothetical protein N7470_005141 [Penicillium chermesinum]
MPHATTNILAIEGGHDVTGDIPVSGSKNAGLALLAASLLASGPSILEGIPPLSDVARMGRICESLGAIVERASDSLRIDTTHVGSLDVPDRLTRSLRASILTLGPLLARFGVAKLCPPGGCAIGARPIEEHVKGLEKMGAKVTVTERSIEACAPSGLHGAAIHMQTPSVTGTMNLMMAACLASGVTYISNPAREPEVTDLANCLISMGATIQGAGTDHITICGRDKLLTPYKYTVMEDRIEAGTFLILGAMAGDPLAVHNCTAEYQTVLIQKLRAIGAQIDINERSIIVRKARCPVAADIQTGPYPAYPTDLQPQLMALLSKAQGTSRITETIFEERFNQAAGLIAMGADICVDGQDAVISGVRELSGGMVAATDLRAGASLVIAAIAAKGRTVISGSHYIDRGYYGLQNKLRKLGVKVRRPQSFKVDDGERKVETAQMTVSTLCSRS